LVFLQRDIERFADDHHLPLDSPSAHLRLLIFLEPHTGHDSQNVFAGLNDVTEELRNIRLHTDRVA
jgi:hypothetical protein